MWKSKKPKKAPESLSELEELVRALSTRVHDTAARQDALERLVREDLDRLTKAYKRAEQAERRLERAKAADEDWIEEEPVRETGRPSTLELYKRAAGI